jgi:hypothetical protein
MIGLRLCRAVLFVVNFQRLLISERRNSCEFERFDFASLVASRLEGVAEVVVRDLSPQDDAGDA